MNELKAQRSALLPHDELPEDILREVFARCLPRTHNSTLSPRDAPLLLTHVCRRWRDNAQATPNLWSSVHIPLQSPRDWDRAVEEWIARAGVLPLSISFGSLPDTAASTIPCLAPWFKKLQTLSNSLECLSFTLTGKNIDIDAFMEEQRKAWFIPLRLKKLAVHIDDMDLYSIGKEDYASLSCIPLHQVPNLRVLQFSTSFHLLALPECFNHKTPWTNLKVLDLESRTFSHPMPCVVRNGALLSIISRCPNITHLKAFFVGTLSSDSPEVSHNLKLEHVALFLLTLESKSIVEFLRRCDWPAIKTLHVGYRGRTNAPAGGPVVDVIAGKFGGQLTSLRLTYSHFLKRYFLPFLSQLPHLMQLYVEDGVVEEMQIGIWDPSSGEGDGGDEDDILKALTPGWDTGLSQHCCPRLRYLRWDGRTLFSDRAVIDFIQGRASSQVRLTQVVINFNRGPQEDIGAACSGLVAEGLRLRLAYYVPHRGTRELSGVYRGLFVEEDPAVLGWE